MTLDSAIAAAERTEAARDLIVQAQVDVVDLVTLSALELCVLDGPRHPVFEKRVAQAWMRVTDRRRRKVTEEVTAGLVRRGLLIDDTPYRRGCSSCQQLLLQAGARPHARGPLPTRVRCPCQGRAATTYARSASLP